MYENISNATERNSCTLRSINDRLKGSKLEHKYCPLGGLPRAPSPYHPLRPAFLIYSSHFLELLSFPAFYPPNSRSFLSRFLPSDDLHICSHIPLSLPDFICNFSPPSHPQ